MHLQMGAINSAGPGAHPGPFTTVCMRFRVICTLQVLQHFGCDMAHPLLSSHHLLQLAGLVGGDD